MEEYGRLIIIERLNMFSSAITDDPNQTLDHFEANKENDAITSGLLARADALKAKVVKPDRFIERPLFSQFPDQRTSMKIPETDESGVTRWKARTIGRSEAELIGRGRPKKKPATEIITAQNAQPRKPVLSDLRVVPFPPPISNGRAYSLGDSVSQQ